jgi:arsenite methyltransferase
VREREYWKDNVLFLINRNYRFRMKSISVTDRIKIDDGLRKKYIQIAITPEGSFQYPTGEAGLTGQNYDPDLLKKLPMKVLSSNCGSGHPFTLGAINEGESVLDIGCGSGVDTLIAAMMVGKKGRAVGIDIIPEMLRRAQESLRKTALDNVTFQEASGEAIPLPDTSFDVVISNRTFNLIPDKLKALKEVYRVLKPLGQFMIADHILTTEPSDDIKSRIDNWAG